MDYRCTYCRKAYSEVEDLVKSDGNIRFVVKEFPEFLGRISPTSAKFAAIAVRLFAWRCGLQRPTHDALIVLRGCAGQRNPHSRVGLKTLGYDPKPIMARMESSRRFLRISSTPITRLRPS